MSLIWSGRLDSKLSLLGDIIAKVNFANRYGRLNYSTKAYPSPVLTDEEWDVIFKILGVELQQSHPIGSENGNWYINPIYKADLDDKAKKYFYDRYTDRPTFQDQIYVPTMTRPAGNHDWTETIAKLDEEKLKTPPDIVDFIDTSTYARAYGIEDDKNLFRKANSFEGGRYEQYPFKAMPAIVVYRLRQLIAEVPDLGEIEAECGDMEVVDRMEQCLVTRKEGFKINTKEQLDNLCRYYANDKSHSYNIYYDAKTMLPFVHLEDGRIDNSSFKLKMGTMYYKWSRTVKYKEYNDDSVLGHSFTINADTFPEDYQIECETYIRDQLTGKDQRFKITIYRANVSADTSITLQADGDPTTFTMDIDVLAPDNDILMDMQIMDVEEDIYNGGTRIIPQNPRPSITASNKDETESILIPTENNEIY